MSHSPYVDLDRGAWAKLGESAPLPLSAAELDGLRSLGDPVDLDEVREVYLPLTRLLALHIEESERLYGAYRTFLLPGTEPPQRTPFVIGIAGSVSVGKSTIARLLRRLLALLPHGPRVELITTDGFLRPNAELERHGLMALKGFPESYDRRALLQHVEALQQEDVGLAHGRLLVGEDVVDEVRVHRRADFGAARLDGTHELQQGAAVVGLGEALAGHHAAPRQLRVGVEEPVGRDQLHLRAVRQARQEVAQEPRDRGLPDRDRPGDPDDERGARGRLVAGQEECSVRLVQPLGLFDVQGEQPGERQVHLAHLVEVHGVAEAAQPVELGGGECQRGALPQLRPRPPVEIDVRRVRHAQERRRRGAAGCRVSCPSHPVRHPVRRDPEPGAGPRASAGRAGARRTVVGARRARGAGSRCAEHAAGQPAGGALGPAGRPAAAVGRPHRGRHAHAGLDPARRPR